ncbi:MAG TPA: hypothetical protein VJ736_04880 [Actinomycetota bacterium]|nr:hypothetical protein [Actinomycetota bacterium]
MTVLCVAPDREQLAALKRAVVAAEWELTAGATDLRSALDQIDVERPHAMVVVGPYEELVAMVAERFPGMRIVADHEIPGATAVAEMSDAREALRSQRFPGGPVG